MADKTPTFNEALFDAMLRHQIGILRFSGGMRNRVWKLLDATEAELKAKIRRGVTGAGLNTADRVLRLGKLLNGLKETRIAAWKQVDALWFEEMTELALAEPGFFDRVVSSSIPGVELGTVLPDPADLKQIVKSQPFMGKTLRQWSKKVAADDIGRIEDAIKIGLIQGESSAQISRRIVGTAKLKGRDGVTQIARRNAAAITRTTVNGIAAESRKAYAELNTDLMPNELFTATLDARTTPICMRFDGTRWKVGTGPVLPLHFNERSIYSPIADGDAVGSRPRRGFTQRQLVREFGQQKGTTFPKPKGQTSKAARDAIPRGLKGEFDAFARKRMRALTGTTPATTTYQQFLTRQTAAVQQDILGPTRAALFRKGGLDLDKFVEFNGSNITLAQLAERHTDAFLRAGLDPALFK
tara:strand:- start:14876 stop:16111 length:1236 start_codon:yes stop_codon:yes gene_type:complete